MRGLVAEVRSFDRTVQLLFVNQLTINIGFYMLMPYLAAHLSDTLGLAAWVVGLVLGVRNLSQQGMFALGGSLADRIGYRPMIIAGCTLRTVGFALLGVVDAVPALLVASAVTGFAGALFNPAMRAYLAQEAPDRRVEAFATFNVFYQAGILVGPLIGVLLTGVDFRLTCLVAAGVFAGLTLLQLRYLPTASPRQHDPTSPSVVADWRQVLANLPFLLFSGAMIGLYVLSFQVYLALPLEVRRVAGSDRDATVGIGLLFAISGLLAVGGQVRIAAWCKRRWSAGQAITRGLSLMGLAFVPLLLVNLRPGWPETTSGVTDLAVAYTPALVATALLTLGTLVVYPFEMDTIVTLAGDRLVTTHYGMYNTLAGIGITVGNLGTGAALDAAYGAGVPALPWIALSALGAACAMAIAALTRRGALTVDPAPVGSVR